MLHRSTIIYLHHCQTFEQYAPIDKRREMAISELACLPKKQLRIQLCKDAQHRVNYVWSERDVLPCGRSTGRGTAWLFVWPLPSCPCSPHPNAYNMLWDSTNPNVWYLRQKHMCTEIQHWFPSFAFSFFSVLNTFYKLMLPPTGYQRHLWPPEFSHQSWS